MPNRAINGDTEGFGMVFVEAAACGKPALAGNAGGTGAAVVEGRTGLRINGEKLDDVINALEHLLDHGGRNMGQNGYHRAQESFSWEQVTAKTHAIHLN
jgi:phosphatidylinositol alpha-1,6-mannosyltransferase